MWSKSLEVLNPYEASLKMLENSNSFSVTQKFAVHVIEMHDEAIYNAVVEAAREAGINQLYLLDKKFVLEALREKVEREKGCEYCENVPSRYRAIRAEGFYQVAADEVDNPELQVTFCPVCGRKLTIKEESQCPNT